MSVLDTPRLTFRGQITWDPIVTNNDPTLYSEAASEPILGGSTALQYRAERIANMAVERNWNIDGTHRSVLFATTVTGVDVGAGPTTDDPVVGVPLELNGMLVDADPYGFRSSQLFYDSFTAGIDGGCRIVVPGDRPFCARRINMSRNSGYQVTAGGASVVWQASSTGPITIDPFDSGALALLDEHIAAGRAAGITVRFNTYRTEYYGVEAPGAAERAALQKQLRGGGFQPNPARSLVVGVIGLWHGDEPEHEPGDRTLIPVGGTPVAAAFAKVDGNRLTVDLGNAIPETSFAVPKADLGPIELQATSAAGPVSLGTLQPADYDRKAYEASSGIVTLDLDATQAAAAADGDITVHAEGAVILEEQELVALPATPNLYLDEMAPASLEVQVWRRGRPVTEKTSVLVVRPAVTDPVTETTDDHGHLTLPVDDDAGPGAWLWIFLPYDDQPPPVPSTADTQTMGYATTRVLPQDEELDALPPTWRNVYRHVLVSWKALAPCMDNWLDLSDEAACEAMAPRLVALTSPTMFDRFTFMPVTRDMTAGQRSLLHRWCASVTGATGPPAPVLAAAPDPVDVERVAARRERRSSRGM